MNLKVNETTKAQAMEYADNEAEINGFGRGSQKWQSALQDYIKFAIGTMSVGRNPRSFRYKTFVAFYSALGDQGFAGEVAKNYVGPSGRKNETKLSDIQNRIIASVTNLSKLYENGILGIRTTTIGGEQGEIPNDKMSQLQLPDKESFKGSDYDKEANQVVRNWVIRDILSTIILELLMPFFDMTEADFNEIAKRINLDQAELSNIKTDRKKYVEAIQREMRAKLSRINIRKLLLG